MKWITWYNMSTSVQAFFVFRPRSFVVVKEEILPSAYSTENFHLENILCFLCFIVRSSEAIVDHGVWCGRGSNGIDFTMNEVALLAIASKAEERTITWHKIFPSSESWTYVYWRIETCTLMLYHCIMTTLLYKDRKISWNIEWFNDETFYFIF